MPSARPRSPANSGRTWPRPTTAQPCASTSTARRSPRRPHTGAIATSTNPLQIGGDSIYGQFFAGLIDEVRVYNVALTAAQIQTDMATPVSTGPDTQPPSQPGTLTATAVSGGEVDLAWGASTDNVGVTGYQVERCQGSGCSNFTQIATPTGTTLQRHRPQPRPPATATASAPRDAAGNLSRYSNIAGATTPTPDTPAAVAAGDADGDCGQRRRGRSWPGGRRPTTSASPATRSNAARAAGCTNFVADRHRPPARATKTPASAAVHQLQLPRPRHDAAGNLEQLFEHRRRQRPQLPRPVWSRRTL